MQLLCLELYLFIFFNSVATFSLFFFKALGLFYCRLWLNLVTELFWSVSIWSLLLLIMLSVLLICLVGEDSIREEIWNSEALSLNSRKSLWVEVGPRLSCTDRVWERASTWSLQGKSSLGTETVFKLRFTARLSVDSVTGTLPTSLASLHRLPPGLLVSSQERKDQSVLLHMLLPLPAQASSPLPPGAPLRSPLPSGLQVSILGRTFPGSSLAHLWPSAHACPCVPQPCHTHVGQRS